MERQPILDREEALAAHVDETIRWARELAEKGMAELERRGAASGLRGSGGV